ncbi:DEAD/DEAH box RNA helicase [uncultured virus]|nr:DEAD/DEAH box RNA helicase [uncultured virus]
MNSLSTVVLEPAQLADISMRLGTASTLFRMLSRSGLEEQRDEWKVHETILKVLQELGLPKKGLPGQQPLSDKNRYTKPQVMKALAKINQNQKERLRNILPDDFHNLLDPSNYEVELSSTRVPTSVSEFSKKSKPKELNLLATQLLKMLLTKSSAESCSRAQAKLDANMNNNKSKLDDWQQDMVNRVKSGQSVLLTGPPSGGKTFASMVALDVLVSSNNEIFVIYVAPTSHLALQVYSNTRATFPEMHVSILTSMISHIQTEARLMIGTPVELLSYLQSNDLHYNIGIIDEVHTILYDEEIGNNLALILSRCNKQILALSATVPQEEKAQLGTWISEKANVEMTYLEYNKRSTPLFEHYYDGKTITQNPPITYKDIGTNESLLNLLVKMRSGQLLPALCFFQDDVRCYERFRSFVKYLRRTEEGEYRHWYEINANFERPVREMQKRIDQIQLDRSENRIDTDTRWEVDRFALIATIEKALNEATIDSASPHEKQDLLKELAILSELRNDEFGMTLPCSGVGPRYRFGVPIDVFTWMLKDAGDRKGRQKIHDNKEGLADVSIQTLVARATNDRKDHQKLNDRYRNLIDAEGISDLDANSIMKTMGRAARYGISLILPTFPFVVQAEVLRLVSDRKLGLVFAGSSMASGVNYPFKTVVIHNDGKETYPDYLVKQMAGRAGRRGFDNAGGHVIYWNYTKPTQPPCIYPESIFLSLKDFKLELSKELVTMINEVNNPIPKPKSTDAPWIRTIEVDPRKNKVRNCNKFPAKLVLPPVLPIAQRLNLTEAFQHFMSSVELNAKRSRTENYQLIQDINRLKMYIHRLYLELQETKTIMAQYLFIVYHYIHIWSVHLLTC